MNVLDIPLWYDCSKTDDSLLLSNSAEIIKVFRQIAPLLFSKIKRSEKTRIVKKALILLGHKSGYKVYSNGLNKNDLEEIGKGFVNKEWLYDLQWYTEPENVYEKNEGYITKSFSMVMECEWDIKRREDRSSNDYSAMKYDLQKIICSNASLQVMIFKLKNTCDLIQIDEHMMKILNIFENRTKTSIILLVGVNQNESKILYREIKSLT